MKRSASHLFLAILATLLAAQTSVAFVVGMPKVLGTEALDADERGEFEVVLREELRAAFPSESWEMTPADILGISLAQKDLRPEACAEDECFARMGRELELDLFIVGYFRRNNEEDRVLLKLYDMGTGKMEGFIRVSGTGAGTLRNSLPEACQRLLHPYRNWEPEETEAKVEDTDAAMEAWAAQSDGEVKSLVGGNEKKIERGQLAASRAATPRYDQPRWSFGLHASTFSGASHAILLHEINLDMKQGGGTLVSPFQNFDVGSPVGGKARWHYKGPIVFSGTYFFTQYETSAEYIIHGWETDRKLESNLHEVQLAVEYSLSFINSRTIDPFLGAGILYSYADSHLDINLNNVDELGPGNGDIYPSRTFRVESQNSSFGATAFAGLNYNLNRKVTLQGLLAGTMVQIGQGFVYKGSLQYFQPESSDEDIGNPALNDILGGSHPFDLNGLRLSIGLLFSL